MCLYNGISLLREEHSIERDGVCPELFRESPGIFRENSGKIPGEFHKKRSLFFKKLQNRSEIGLGECSAIRWSCSRSNSVT